MGRILLLALTFVSLRSGAETWRYVFRSNPPTASFKQMTFGLSSQKIQAIRDLTAGQIDFSSIYYLDLDSKKQTQVQTWPGFSGIIYPNVPPPLVVGDPELDQQWWIQQLHVKDAWTYATGAGVTIADCDAGFYTAESDLVPNLLIDQRYDLSNSDEPLNVQDGNFISHGTAVAAIMIGARDGVGTNGIAYNAKLVPLQNFNYDEKKDKIDKEEATARCILHAIQTPNVRVLVLENQTQNGSSETFIGTRDAVRLALKAGLIVISAAGNSSVELLEEQKDDTGSIIVGAVDPKDTVEHFSNYGARVTVAAYGRNLHTLYGPGGAYGSFGGTSGATPQVAATVALMLEVNPQLTPAQAQAILVNTRITSDTNNIVGGRLDTAAAVLAAKTNPIEFGTWNESWLFRQQLTAILKD